MIGCLGAVGLACILAFGSRSLAGFSVESASFTIESPERLEAVSFLAWMYCTILSGILLSDSRISSFVLDQDDSEEDIGFQHPDHKFTRVSIDCAPFTGHHPGTGIKTFRSLFIDCWHDPIHSAIDYYSLFLIADFLE